MVREILLLGNPQLYEVSEPVTEDDAAQLPAWIGDLRDTLHDFRNRVGQARAIAAPQIGLIQLPQRIPRSWYMIQLIGKRKRTPASSKKIEHFVSGDRKPQRSQLFCILNPETQLPHGEK